MTAKKKKRIIALAVSVALLLLLVIWTAWGNFALELNTYTISSKRLPEIFDGYRIAHVSDMHNAELGNKNEKLLSMLKEANPDMIAMTGDLIDSRHTNVEVALQFARDAMQIAPCYYVTGNHEKRIQEFTNFKHELEALGVEILDDEAVMLEREGERIELIGINDPAFWLGCSTDERPGFVKEKLEELMSDEKIYHILFIHRPELFEAYVKSDVDVVLSGHAHGGQFRLPFIGGLWAPNQGFVPKYDSGVYTEQNTSMFVSRGIGNSLFPFRFNNRPEVILVELCSD